MPQHTPAPRLCRDCDGHASAMVTTGSRHRDGTRTVIRVVCPACQGTGHRTSAAAFARVGK
ncbi:hypothetical protein ACPCIU_08235 [Streptomyces seoulensis]|uniref:hypothetical protein n=1 Tax=Streptomyces seoulensis TaxID=73044 RepID=UPI003C3054BB